MIGAAKQELCTDKLLFSAWKTRQIALDKLNRRVQRFRQLRADDNDRADGRHGRLG